MVLAYVQRYHDDGVVCENVCDDDGICTTMKAEDEEAEDDKVLDRSRTT